MIDDQRKFIFVENPKTATYSIRTALMGKENSNNPYDSRIATINHDIPEIIASKYPKKWRTYTTFVVVRNTWDRAHSFFAFYRNIARSASYQSMDFDEWVAAGCPPPVEDHFRAPMHGEGRFDDVLCQLRYIRGVDEVIVLHSFNHRDRCIELQAGIDRICRLLNITVQPLPIDRNYYGRSAKAIIWKRKTIDQLGVNYEEEIRRFGFQAPLAAEPPKFI